MIMHYIYLNGQHTHYLCNQACYTTEEKLTNDSSKVTCKNCKRALDKRAQKAGSVSEVKNGN